MTVLANGKFIVAWQDSTEVDGNPVIKAQLFDSNCAEVGSTVTFHIPTASLQTLKITQLADESFVLLFTVHNGTDVDVFVATCSETGTIRMEPTLAGQSAAGDQFDPQVIALTNGSFAVGWMEHADNTSKFMIEVFGASTPENNAPTGIKLGGQTTVAIAESTGVGAAIGTLSATDADGDTITGYALAEASAFFEIANDGGAWKVKLKAGVDYETVAQRQHVLKITASDGTKTSAVQDITINITNVNDTAPTGIKLGGQTTLALAESTAAGAVIGTLSATDADGDAITGYALAEASAFFEIVNENGTWKVKLKAGVDYETAAQRQHVLKITATDGTRTSAVQDITINVTDIVEAVAGGTRGRNVLVGGDGADRLDGGYGNDRLTGGLGEDVFVFSSRLGTHATDRQVNFDTIIGFEVGRDTIQLSDTIFKKIGRGTEANPTKLDTKFFKIGSKATTKDHHILYNKNTGVLSFDADGTGAKKAVEFAKIGKGLKLTADHFEII